MIEVEGLSKLYGDREAVQDLSFTAEAGQILALVGPNGAGKTTTLRMICGILPATRGSVRVAGHDLASEPMAAKRALALVPDDPPLFPNLTVEEHLELSAELYQVDDWRTRATTLLEELALADRRETLADELSRGMRQKVAVACALLHGPKVLLLDEPITGLDPRGIRTLFAAIRRAADEGAAVIISTHLLGQIEGLAQRFLILREGRRLFLGSREDIAAELPALQGDASLEEIFFEATERIPSLDPPAFLEPIPQVSFPDDSGEVPSVPPEVLAEDHPAEPADAAPPPKEPPPS